MKKLSAILASILILALLCSCDMTAKEDNTDSSKDSEKITLEPNQEETPAESDTDDVDTAFPKSFSTALNNNDYDVSVDSSSYDSITKRYTSKDIVACDISMNIKVEGTEITLLSTTVQEFMDSGWTIIRGNKADAIIKPNVYTNATLENAEGKTVTVFAASDKENETVFADCKIMEVNISYSSIGHFYSSVHETADFLLCDTLSKASTYSDIIKELGKPRTVFVTNYASGKTSVTFIYSHTYSNISDIRFTFYEKDSSVVMEEFDIAFK